ncbi:MAG: histidinol dehydrogenase [Bacteroidales bacterium]|nr:histidinol dehydrogenase [Bacteroidales bacterium]
MNIYTNPQKSEWKALTERATQNNDKIATIVAGILDRVRKDGDKALRELAREIDGVEIDSLEVSDQEKQEAAELVSAEVKEALDKAYSNIRKFHEAQLPKEVEVETTPGVRCYQRPVPIQKIGLYIPGGNAPLFSTVLMLAIPAAVAGCPDVILCTPTDKQGKVAPAVVYAATLCGVRHIYKTGGAQAIAAMAYGTETITKRDKIFGPGNRFVTMAKQSVSVSEVAIDMPAGPSEVMVMADETAKPEFIASDLLSQCEHGADSQAILVCDSMEIADKVQACIEDQLKGLSRTSALESSLGNSRAIVMDTKEAMIEFANAYGSEHLIIAMDKPWDIAAKITAAGSVFIGNWSCESAGDYASGTNHTLPTSGWAHSYSGVNIDSFIRKITYQELSQEGLKGLSNTIITMADAEGLDAHANAVKVRIK